MTSRLRTVPLLMVLAVAAASCGASHRVALPAPSPTTTAPTPSTSTTVTRSPPPTSTTVPNPPGVTTVATLKAAAPGHLSPGGPATGIVPATWYGYSSSLPVIARRPGWVQVRLAQRPNQSTTWLPVADVTLSTTPWRLVLSLTTEHLQVFVDDRLVGTYPAGIGTANDPTVTGHYFVAMKVPPPDPGYGAFVLATSAHSDAIADWDGSNDALIGIHGPIDAHDDALIGTTGFALSHGCIRLHDADLVELAGVLPGSPLDIVS
jgi:hypothetical protein